MGRRRVGIWLIGAFGGVGSSTALGLAALRNKLISPTGLVTALPQFANLDLDAVDDMVIGGHEVRIGDFAGAAKSVGGSKPAFAAELVESCRSDLDAWTANVQSHSDSLISPSRCQADWHRFIELYRLDQMVVVNVASSEPPSASACEAIDLSAVRAAAEQDRWAELPASCWYAYAALDAQIPYVNFTPSTGVNLPALLELAEVRQVPVAGSDGKTGETLVKSVLAPMFAARNFNVRSWVGHNVLGNGDGKNLSRDEIRQAKLRSKDRAVNAILGEGVQSRTTIEYVEPLDDWKIAWDHIQFDGFLGVPMSLQFTWQGCDSALAAPLVIDLARLVLLAQRRGESGPLPYLAPFFKSPLGTSEQDFGRQMAMLDQHVQSMSQ